jgi:hypothetical protein
MASTFELITRQMNTTAQQKEAFHKAFADIELNLPLVNRLLLQ